MSPSSGLKCLPETLVFTYESTRRQNPEELYRNFFYIPPISVVWRRITNQKGEFATDNIRNKHFPVKFQRAFYNSIHIF
jgi:hypothetical protein